MFISIILQQLCGRWKFSLTNAKPTTSNQEENTNKIRSGESTRGEKTRRLDVTYPIHITELEPMVTLDDLVRLIHTIIHHYFHRYSRKLGPSRRLFVISMCFVNAVPAVVRCQFEERISWLVSCRSYQLRRIQISFVQFSSRARHQWLRIRFSNDKSLFVSPWSHLCFEEFHHSSDTCYIAHCYPYTFTDLRDYLNHLSLTWSRQIFRRDVLFEWQAGNPCFLIITTDESEVCSVLSRWSSLFVSDVPMHKKKFVFLMARIHPGETNSSYMMRGLLEFIKSNERSAHANRSSSLIGGAILFLIIWLLNYSSSLWCWSFDDDDDEDVYRWGYVRGKADRSIQRWDETLETFHHFLMNF